MVFPLRRWRILHLLFVPRRLQRGQGHHHDAPDGASQKGQEGQDHRSRRHPGLRHRRGAPAGPHGRDQGLSGIRVRRRAARQFQHGGRAQSGARSDDPPSRRGRHLRRQRRRSAGRDRGAEEPRAATRRRRAARLRWRRKPRGGASDQGRLPALHRRQRAAIHGRDDDVAHPRRDARLEAARLRTHDVVGFAHHDDGETSTSISSATSTTATSRRSTTS